jgi:ribA/ribD-fused uncharacterized protein
METDKYVLFYGHTQNTLGLHIFSQWYPCQFTEYLEDHENPIIYCSAEQYMMAQKAMLFDDSITLGKILNTTDQETIKKLGRKVKNFDENKWNEYKFDIVVNGNRHKFGQNPKLMKRLLQTGNKTIVEASPYDFVWGIGLRAADAVKIPESEWPGENLLGKALMVVRDEQLNH